MADTATGLGRTDQPAPVGHRGVVDAHVHLLPGRLAEKVRAFYNSSGPIGLVYPLDHLQVCEQLASEGITEVWSLPYAHKAGIATGLNVASAETARQALDVAVIGGATVHPDDDHPLHIVRAAVEDHGLRVLKLHCSVGRFQPTDRRLDAVWDYVERVHLPVVIHAGHAVTGTTNDSDLALVDITAHRHPDARIIIAHCGHHAVDDAIGLLDAHPNVYADLTPVVADLVPITPFDAARLSAKLLFGTDAPNTPLLATRCLEHLDSLQLTTAQRNAITGDNARELIAAVDCTSREPKEPPT